MNQRCPEPVNFCLQVQLQSAIKAIIQTCVFEFISHFTLRTLIYTVRQFPSRINHFAIMSNADHHSAQLELVDSLFTNIPEKVDTEKLEGESSRKGRYMQWLIHTW